MYLLRVYHKGNRLSKLFEANLSFRFFERKRQPGQKNGMIRFAYSKTFQAKPENNIKPIDINLNFMLNYNHDNNHISRAT